MPYADMNKNNATQILKDRAIKLNFLSENGKNITSCPS